MVGVDGNTVEAMECMRRHAYPAGCKEHISVRIVGYMEDVLE